MGMFDADKEFFIDNDLKKIVQRFDKFYKREPIFPEENAVVA
jgi:hypothetical protein